MRIPRPRRTGTLRTNGSSVGQLYKSMRVVMPPAREQATLDFRVEREYERNVRAHQRTLERERQERDYLDGMNWGRVAELLDEGYTLDKAKARVLREMAKGTTPYMG